MSVKKKSELNSKNQELLDEMKFYILTSSASEKMARKVLEELEDHLLLAQQDGKSFDDVFGKDPKSFCDELIKEIPKRTLWEQSKLIFLSIFLLFQWKLAEGIDGHLHLKLFDAGVYLIVSILLAGIFWIVLQKTSFRNNKTAYWMICCLALFAFSIYLGLAFTEKQLLPEGPSIQLDGLPAYLIGAMGMIIIIASLYWSTMKSWFRPK